MKILLFFLLASLTSPAIPASKRATQHGIASWYGGKFANRLTASGKRFNPLALTAAHKTLPFGTKVLVTNLKTQRKLLVTITDRGPFVRGRIIDLSMRSAKLLGITGIGLIKLEVV